MLPISCHTCLYNTYKLRIKTQLDPAWTLVGHLYIGSLHYHYSQAVLG